MSDRTTSLQIDISADPAAVYQALINADDVRQWMVPDEMSSVVHEFDARVGGRFRISLTYNNKEQRGKSTGHTDTYHGIFSELVPDQTVVQVMQFETSDHAMQGLMTARFQLDAIPNGTRLTADHLDLPPGLSIEDNATGWTMSLRKLAALVEQRSALETEV